MPSAPTSPPDPLRRQVETASRPVLLRLHGLPRPVVPLATLVLIGVGAFAPVTVAVVAFALLFAFIAWIAYLSWPVTDTTGRLMRLAMLALIVVLGLFRFAT